MKRALLFAAALLASPVDAASSPRPSPSPRPAATNDAPWTTARLSAEICGPDDWEPLNRGLFWIEDVIMTYGACPLSWVYGSILPRPVIKGVNNAVNNIEYPVRLFASLCRGEGTIAWHETERFFVNTTVGLGGLFDPALYWCGIVGTDASFAGTFATWGIPKGPSLVIPFVPHANVRDDVGYFVDWAFDPRTYFDWFFDTGLYVIGWSATLWPNKAAVWIAPWEMAIPDQLDPYATYRQVLCAKSLMDENFSTYHYATDLIDGKARTKRPPVRKSLAKPAGLKGRWREIPGYGPRTPALDALRTALFVPERSDDFWWISHSIFNGDFAHDVDKREVLVATNCPAARYGFVRADGEAAPECAKRLVFIVPGVGSCYDSDSTFAMAELLHKAGVNVVLCDDPFDFQYMRSVNGGVLPGNVPEDAKRFAVFARAVIADLQADEALKGDPEVTVIGWSMGGLLTAHLSALAKKEDLGFRTKTFLAVNAPVSFDSIAKAVDAFAAVSKGWTAEDAREHFLDVTSRVLVWNDMKTEKTPDISDDDAKVSAAMALDLKLPGLVALSAHTNADVSIDTYVNRYLTAAYPGRTAASIVRAAGLRSIEAQLRGNAALQMIHTRDDFLLDDADRAFLDNALMDRITWFAAGSHCGYFYTNEFKNEVLRRLGLTGGGK